MIPNCPLILDFFSCCKKSHHIDNIQTNKYHNELSDWYVSQKTFYTQSVANIRSILVDSEVFEIRDVLNRSLLKSNKYTTLDANDKHPSYSIHSFKKV